MKYLKLFETATAFESARASLDKPNVSLSENDMNVHYLPYDPYNGHDYVEIGGLKWATMNIGANRITDYGLYFQWGSIRGIRRTDVSSIDTFTWDDYRFSDNGTSTMTKYNSTDGKTTLDIEDDAAHVNWGGNWRMPTAFDFQNLINSTTTEHINGGVLFTDKNDNSKTLFFPKAGYCYNRAYNGSESAGMYWSSSRNNVTQAKYFDCYSSPTINDRNKDRCYGFSIRPVID